MRNDNELSDFLFYKYSIILSNRILDRSELSFWNIIIVITSILVKTNISICLDIYDYVIVSILNIEFLFIYSFYLSRIYCVINFNHCVNLLIK